MRTAFYPDMYDRHYLIFESAYSWLEDVTSIYIGRGAAKVGPTRLEAMMQAIDLMVDVQPEHALAEVR